jgi:hypothetical protein
VRRACATFAALLLVAFAGACADDRSNKGTASDASVAPSPAAPSPEPPATRECDLPTSRRACRSKTARARLKPARCPAGLSNCATADGEILYVERVDPDGDGDAHFVLTSNESITLPGLSVIDVKKSLRPRPLPGVGDRISAAGPVYRGSYGQKQIEAIELHVARARG